MLITETYRALNHQLHDARPDYGTTAPKYADQVTEIAVAMGAQNILDYGCGKGLLAQALSSMEQAPNICFYEYDPAIPGKDVSPDPAELVCCIDVLEHIEPDCLTEVLEDLRRLTTRAAFLTVATRPAKKWLADGRNAHLIVKSVDWWMPQLIALWSPRFLQVVNGGEFTFLGVPGDTYETAYAH